MSRTFYTSLMGLLFLILLVTAWSSYNNLPLQNKDQHELIFRTDCPSGRQYLTTPRGGLSPRWREDGKQFIDKSQCDSTTGLTPEAPPISQDTGSESETTRYFKN